MLLKLKAAAALAALALIVLTSGSAGAGTTAAQVRDDETLKAFVEGAKAHIESLTSVDEILGLKSELRTEGTWKAGSVMANSVR